MNAGGGDDVIDAEDTNKEPDTISCGGGDEDWVWIQFDPNIPDPKPTDESIDINKSTGKPFKWEDVNTTFDGPPLGHDPATALAGCEYVSDGQPSLGDWLRKMGKPKKHKKR
jgi:hypothetical protein